MSTMGSLERLEHSIYRSQVDHGLLDILMGAFLIAIGLMLHADLDYMPVVVFFVGMFALKEARRRLIEPRIGHVRLKAERRARLKAWRWLTLLALVVAVFGVLALSAAWAGSTIPTAHGCLVVTGCLRFRWRWRRGCSASIAGLSMPRPFLPGALSNGDSAWPMA